MQAAASPIDSDQCVFLTVLCYLQRHAPHAVTLLHEYYSPAHDGSVSEQIRDMNRFWRQQLLMLPASTTMVRESLQDHLSLSQYTAMMTEYFLPTIIGLGLPRPWELYTNPDFQCLDAITI